MARRVGKDGPTAVAEPSPISVTLPPKLKRKTHFRAPLGETTSHKPAPSPYRPCFAVAAVRAVNLPAISPPRKAPWSYNWSYSSTRIVADEVGLRKTVSIGNPLFSVA
jgi:hypothetical protein